MVEDGGWVPAFEGQRPPFQPGNPGGGRPAVHGVYSEKKRAPLRDAIMRHLSEHSPAYAEGDDHARWALANVSALCELAYQHVDEHGMFDERGRLRPVLDQVAKWEKEKRALMRELGMTTMARADLDLTRLNAASEWVALHELQDALRSALELATKYVPRDRQNEYLAAARLLLSESPQKEMEP